MIVNIIVTLLFFVIYVVSTGKWMYEVMLGSKGIMQLGWATLRCRFTNEVQSLDISSHSSYICL